MSRVPNGPSNTSLTRLTVGSPVSPMGPARMNDDLLFLNCRNAQPIISAVALPLVTTTTHVYNVAFTKAPGVQCLRISVEPNVSAAGTRPSFKCAVTSTGPYNWCEGGELLFLDGSQDIITDVTPFRDFQAKTNTMDVSDFTNGTIYDLTFTITDTSATAGVSRGLYCINITEVPISDTDAVGNPTTELGADSAWLVSTDRNRIVDGDPTAVSYGMSRLFQQFEYARYQKPRQSFQMIRPEHTSWAWNTTSTTVGNAWPFGFATNPTFTIRTRSINGTNVPNAYSFRLRYRTSTTQQAWLRVAVTVSGVTTNNDFKLPTTSGAWVASALQALTIPCSGTGQEATIKLGLWNDSAGTVYVSNIYGPETEV